MKDLPENWMAVIWTVIFAASVLYFFTMVGGCFERSEIRQHEIRLKTIEATMQLTK